MSALVAPDPFAFPPCPICAGRVDIVYDRFHQRVGVCVDCHASMTVPSSSWEVARLKREGKWTPIE
jgi:hypothetical protein